MANKIRFYHYWNLKAILTSSMIIVVLLSLYLVYYNYPSLYNKYKMSKYDGQTSGIILNINENSIIRQTNEGSYTDINNYEVLYRYEVDGKPFESIDFIGGNVSNGKKLKLLWDSGKTVTIRFMKAEPSKSAIDLTE